MRGNAFSQHSHGITGSELRPPWLNRKLPSCKTAADLLQMSFTVRAIKSLCTGKGLWTRSLPLCVTCDNKLLDEAKSTSRPSKSLGMTRHFHFYRGKCVFNTWLHLLATISAPLWTFEQQSGTWPLFHITDLTESLAVFEIYSIIRIVHYSLKSSFRACKSRPSSSPERSLNVPGLQLQV